MADALGRKPMKTLPALFVTALTLIASVSYGDEFQYSYTFNNGDVASGTFAGTLTGNLINDISNATVTIDGYTLTGTIFDESFSGARYVDGGATASLDGTQNNFLFINSDFAAGDTTFTGYFGSITVPPFGDLVQASYPSIFGNIVDQPINASWLVTVTGVPEGGATLGMLLSGMAALACFCRRKPIAARSLGGY
jgi:hypothetical protein